ncbi:MAG: MerR family transcriptional regulator [Eggerthellaceae bacterium]|nr:MerR family transcriptional regulator [Eggerthellaceae bacterium]
MARDKGLKRRLTCGQMAKANCVTEKTLRFYQKKGLLEPSDVDEDTGFRYYDILQSTKLDMITHLRAIGLSLDAILAIDERKDIGFLMDCVEGQLTEIRQQQRDLAVAEQIASELQDDCAAYLARPLCDTPLLEVLPSRRALEFRFPELTATLERSEDLTTSDQWEWALRLVKQRLVDRGWPLSLFRNVGFSTTLERCREPLGWAECLFVPVDPSFGPAYEESRALPAGSHAVLYITDGYDQAGGSLDADRFGMLLDFAERSGLVPAGDPYCEAICRYQRFFNQSLESFSRYALPVARR